MSPRNRKRSNASATKRRRNATATREAIQREALAAFTRSGYDGVGLREIAKAARVDPRMVGLYFGSKEELFADVLKLTTGVQPTVPPICENAAVKLLTELRPESYLHGYFMTIRSTSNPRAVEILRAIIEQHGERPVSAQLSGAHRRGRAALLIAIFMGILLMRDILGSTALTEDEAAELVPYLEAVFQTLAEPSQGPTRADTTDRKPRRSRGTSKDA